jgi:hypothetical protein
MLLSKMFDECNGRLTDVTQLTSPKDFNMNNRPALRDGFSIGRVSNSEGVERGNDYLIIRSSPSDLENPYYRFRPALRDGYSHSSPSDLRNISSVVKFKRLY